MKARVVLFDLDMTLVDSSALDAYRHQGHWPFVMQNLGLVRPLGAGPGSFAHELPGKLRRFGCRVGVVTSSPRHYATALLDRFGVEHDVLVAHGDTPESKPNPQPLQKALQLMGASSSDAIHVGDDPIDTQAAHRAGVLSVGAGWGKLGVEVSSAAPDILLTRVPPAAVLAGDLSVFEYFAEACARGGTARQHGGSVLACETGPAESTFALGRYFKQDDARHAHHALSTSILGAKDDPARMAMFAPAVATAIGALRSTPDVLVRVPPKPGEIDRFSELLRQIEHLLQGTTAIVLDGLRLDRAVDGYKRLGAAARSAARDGAIGTAYLWSDKRVAVIDDVHTTGATINECARTLLAAGAASVVAIALGKAQHSVVTKVCPACGRDMVTRTNSRTGEKFWGCKGYPDCKRTISLPPLRETTSLLPGRGRL